MDPLERLRRAGLLGAVTFVAVLAAIPAGSVSPSSVVARLRGAPSLSAESLLPSPSPLPTLVPAGHVPILMYHYIRVNPNPRDGLGFRLSVTPVEFQRQMRWAYEHGFHTISLADLHAALSSGSALDSHSFVLTFDDGHVDFYTVALPVLRRFGFTATAYIVPGFIGRPDYMTWEQLLDADRMGTNIGAHTLTHHDLTRQPTAAAQAEISASKAQLEARLGHGIDDFCYPAGRYNQRIVELVRGAGFRDATTTAVGAFESLDTAFHWPRVRIGGSDRLSDFVNNLMSGIVTYQRDGHANPPSFLPSPSDRPAPSPSPGLAGRLDRV